MQHCDIDSYVVLPNYVEKFFSDKILLEQKSKRIYKDGHFYFVVDEIWSMEKDGKTQTFDVRTTTRLI